MAYPLVKFYWQIDTLKLYILEEYLPHNIISKFMSGHDMCKGQDKRSEANY